MTYFATGLIILISYALTARYFQWRRATWLSLPLASRTLISSILRTTGPRKR